MEFERFEAITFDCYGTLIDWESGILRALRSVLEHHGESLDDEALLEMYAAEEARAESGPYRPYRDVLREVVRGFGQRLGFLPDEKEVDCLSASLGDWQPFADTVAALRALGRGRRLGILSNIDDDLFAATAQRLEVDFEWVITAQQVGSYKPSSRNFEFAIETIGLPPQSLLHVAQSLFHDIVPAREHGLATVWIDRRGARAGGGATLPVDARADLELPDLASLVTAMGADG